jgi:hypothetical protein
MNSAFPMLKGLSAASVSATGVNAKVAPKYTQIMNAIRSKWEATGFTIAPDPTLTLDMLTLLWEMFPDSRYAGMGTVPHNTKGRAPGATGTNAATFREDDATDASDADGAATIIGALAAKVLVSSSSTRKYFLVGSKSPKCGHRVIFHVIRGSFARGWGWYGIARLQSIQQRLAELWIWVWDCTPAVESDLLDDSPFSYRFHHELWHNTEGTSFHQRRANGPNHQPI